MFKELQLTLETDSSGKFSLNGSLLSISKWLKKLPDANLKRTRNQRRIRQWKITPSGLGPMSRDIILFVVFILIFLPPRGRKQERCRRWRPGIGRG